MKSLFHDVLTKVAISPQSANNTTINGNTIDTAGYEGVCFEGLVGAIDAAVTYKVQAGALADASDMADVTGLSQAFTATDDNKPTKLDYNKPAKRYARLVAVCGNGTAQLIGGTAELYGGRIRPETQSFGGAFVTGV